MLSLKLAAASAFGSPGPDQAALYIGQAAEDCQHQASGAGVGIGSKTECPQWVEAVRKLARSICA
jgi:hypothetical protein